MIIVNRLNGHAVAGGPADTIRAALRGAAPLTIGGKQATGDIVWLAPIRRTTWADGMTAETSEIAHTLTHPVHGEIAYAYIDTDRLDQAPQLAALEREARNREWIAARDAENRAAAVVPSCDNCGDCPKCC